MAKDDNQFWSESHLSSARGWFDRLHEQLADSPGAAVSRDNARTYLLASIAYSLADIAGELEKLKLTIDAASYRR